MKKTLCTLTWLTAITLVAAADGQTTTTYEDGPDGVKYQVTHQVVPQSIPTTEIQTRQQNVYRPQVTTEYQSYQQTYLTPVTEYRLVPHLRNWWNPLGEAYWTNDYVPVTRWEARPATVQIPVARTNWVAETQTTQVPVTTYRTVAADTVSRVPIGISTPGAIPAAPGATATSVASRPITVGSQQYQGDPPRTASPWATSSDTLRR